MQLLSTSLTLRGAASTRIWRHSYRCSAADGAPLYRPRPSQDPIFKGNKVPNLEMGYPGGIFDPLGFSKGNLKELQTKEIKNGRLAMVAFAGFTLQARGTRRRPPAMHASAVCAALPAAHVGAGSSAGNKLCACGNAISGR